MNEAPIVYETTSNQRTLSGVLPSVAGHWVDDHCDSLDVDPGYTVGDDDATH